nr:uncharacterized protein LOC127348962 [Lolium perenne]
MRAAPNCRRGFLPSTRPAAASPRAACHSRHAAAATPTAPLPTTSLLPQHASPTPFHNRLRDGPAWPSPPSSLSPASEGSTAVGMTEALPSPASRTVRRRLVHPCVQFVRRRHRRKFTREGRGIPQGGTVLPSPASSTSGGHIAQSGGPLIESAEFTAPTMGSPSTERITPSNTR